jgi:hypothetical protein
MYDNTPTYSLGYIKDNINSIDVAELRIIYHYIEHEQCFYTTTELTSIFSLLAQRVEELLKKKELERNK